MKIINKEIKNLLNYLKRKYRINIVSEGLFGKINLKPKIYWIDSILMTYPFEEKNLYIKPLKEFYPEGPDYSLLKAKNENLSTFDFRYRIGLIIDLLTKLKGESVSSTIGLHEFEDILKKIRALKIEETEEYVELRRTIVKLVKIYSDTSQLEKSLKNLKSIKIRYNKYLSIDKIKTFENFTEDCITEISKKNE